MKRSIVLALAALVFGACAEGADESARGGDAAAAEPADSVDVLFSIEGLDGPEAVRYDEDIDAALGSGARLDAYTRAHLLESRARIDRALDASLTLAGTP